MYGFADLLDLDAAKLACSADSKCVAIERSNCNQNRYSTCTGGRFLVDRTYDTKSSLDNGKDACTYKKTDNYGMYGVQPINNILNFRLLSIILRNIAIDQVSPTIPLLLKYFQVSFCGMIKEPAVVKKIPMS